MSYINMTKNTLTTFKSYDIIMADKRKAPKTAATVFGASHTNSQLSVFIVSNFFEFVNVGLLLIYRRTSR